MATEIKKLTFNPLTGNFDVVQDVAHLAETSYVDTNFVNITQKAAANGVATLGADSKIPASQIPKMAITDTYVVASEVAMLALTAEVGDLAIRSDESKTYILQGNDPTVLSNWVYLQTPPSPVLSVNSQTGAVVLDSDDISEGSTNLYFTISRAKSAAVADSITDSITDVAPSQNAVYDALVLKANLNSPALTGTPTAPTATSGTSTTQIATTAFVNSAISAIPAGANTTLSNLTSPTAVNQHLLVGGSGNIDLGDGSAGNHFRTIYATEIGKYNGGPSHLAFNNTVKGIYDTGGELCLDWSGGLHNPLYIKRWNGGVARPLKFQAANAGGYVGIKGPYTFSGADILFILPNTLGNAGQVMTNDGAGVLGWTDVVMPISGDITPTTFSLSNNQSTFVDVTGLAFTNATTQSFEIQLNVKISATSNLYETFKILGTQKDSTWDISHTSNGDSSGIIFSITNTGQIQYKSANISGFTSGTMKFRATTIPV